MLAGSETGGALREPHLSRAKQVRPMSVITLLIIWHGVGIHTCHGDYGGEVMPQFGRDLIPLPGGCATRGRSPSPHADIFSPVRAQLAWPSACPEGRESVGCFRRG